jgi:hypothetical protein
MDLADRQKLERIALDRLLASADDEEQWSFVFRTEAAISALYCAWSVAEQWEFDGQIDGLGLQWTPERQKLLKLGEAEPTEEELRQWRKALCRHLADGSDWCSVAWIVPLWIDKKIAGFALFSASAAKDPDDPPALLGIFGSLDEAKAALALEGAIDGE